MTHEIKVDKHFYSRIVDGSKTFQECQNDTGIQPGDIVTLREWDTDPINSSSMAEKGYTDRSIEFTVGFVDGIGGSRIVFSLIPIKKTKEKNGQARS